eukprot:gene10970-22926_t
MSKFVTDSKPYSRVIKLPINGNITAAENALQFIKAAYVDTVRFSGMATFDNDHVELTIVAEENICDDFFNAFKDVLQTTVYVDVDSKISSKITVPVLPVRSNQKAYSFIDMNSLRNLLRGRENEFIRNLEVKYPIHLSWEDEGFTYLKVTSGEKPSLLSFEGDMKLLKQDPYNIDSFFHQDPSRIAAYFPTSVHSVVQEHEDPFIGNDKTKQGVEESKSDYREDISQIHHGEDEKNKEKYVPEVFEKPVGISSGSPSSIPSTYDFNMDVTDVSNLLTIKHWKYLERQYNMLCKVIKNKYTNTSILHCETTIENKENAIMFEEVIQHIVNNPSNFLQEIERQKSKKIHIYVDVSNITIGIQKKSDGTTDNSIRLDVRNLTDLITDLRTVVSAVAVGSDKEIESIAIQKPYWHTWKQNGFKPIILQRTPGKGEQAVDEVLVAQIATEAQKRYPEERTLVILTGDGNDNHGRGTSFPQIIENAMRNDWTVEVWSWSQCTSRNYQIYKTNYPQ